MSTTDGRTQGAAMVRTTRRQFVAGALALPALAGTATAQVTSIRLGKQYGLPFLPQMVMEAQKLIEKHAGALGLAGLQVSWLTMSGPGALNDALLSGSIEFVNVAPPSLATLWEKSANTPHPVRAVCTVQSMPYVLVTRNQNVRTIADFTDKDKIAVPTAKISGQAMMLQIAAAKLWGFDQFERLDPWTVSMGHPDALVAMLSGKSEITGHFTSPPFQFQQLEDKRVHKVLSNFEVLGGPVTFNSPYTTTKFRTENPRSYKAVFDSLVEAQEFIHKSRADAIRIYIEVEKSKLSPEFIAKMMDTPDIKHTLVPENTIKYAHFMHKVGMLKTKPESYKDYYFPEVHDLKGS